MSCLDYLKTVYDRFYGLFVAGFMSWLVIVWMKKKSGLLRACLANFMVRLRACFSSFCASVKGLFRLFCGHFICHALP